MGELLESCKRISVPVPPSPGLSAAWLEKEEVAAWSNMPVWVPLGGTEAGHPFIDISRAVAADGLPADQRTVRGPLDWWATTVRRRKGCCTVKAGITAEREAELLAARHAEHRADC
ncbi:MAG: hypothetical protein IPH48_18925 [bacterium]|nr:hypothetical protein [bacterium]